MPVYRDNYNDRPTLSTFHYMVLPTWWMDHDKDDQNLLIDLNVINTEMEQVAQYYSDMSWGNMDVTYDILSQFTLNITSIDPRWPQVVHACKTHLSNNGYENTVDYDGIIFMNNLSQGGNFQYPGAKGSLNGFFIASDKSHITYKVLRHEIGHNLGHDHHKKSSYTYRDLRPVLPGISDGFDMVSSKYLCPCCYYTL